MSVHQKQAQVSNGKTCTDFRLIEARNERNAALEKKNRKEKVQE